MSKKINTKAINATAEAEADPTPEAVEVPAIESATESVNTTKSLREYFEQYPNASLRKLAAVTGVNYGILLKKSKDPIPGEAYDPEAINWTAIEAKLASKNIDWTTLNWEAMNEGPARKGGTLVKDMDAFQVGMKVYLRRNNSTPYEIVYKTETHIVLMLEGTSEPMAWANNTFLINGPVFQPRAEKVVAEAVEEA